MPRGSDVYRNPWLKAEDLEDDEQTFTITGSDLHEFKDDAGRSKAQIVLMFHETDKKFGLNVTNYGVLKDVFGSDDSDDWHGRRVVLFVTQTTMTDGRRVDCLRIKRKATERMLQEDTSRQQRRQQPPAGKPAPQPARKPTPAMTQEEVDASEDIDINDEVPF